MFIEKGGFMLKTKAYVIIVFNVVLLCCLNCPRATINYALINRESGMTEWQIDNPLLAHDIVIKDVKETVKDNLLFVNILIENGWYRPINGKIKVAFYDASGVQLDNPWGWHPLLLESHQEEWFKFIAPKAEDHVTKIKVMVRGIGKYSMPER